MRVVCIPDRLHYGPPVSSPLRGPRGQRGLRGHHSELLAHREALPKPEFWGISSKGWNPFSASTGLIWSRLSFS